MSNALLNIVWTLAMRPYAKLVLVNLADRANEEGRCWPSGEKIGRDTGMGRRQVFRALKELERMGHISRTGLRGRATTYTVHPIYPQPVSAQPYVPPDTGAHEPVAVQTAPRVRSGTEPVSAETPRIVSNPQRTTAARKHFGTANPQAPTGTSAYEARLKAEARGYGITPGIGESMEAFASRVRAERDKRRHHAERRSS